MRYQSEDQVAAKRAHDNRWTAVSAYVIVMLVFIYLVYDSGRLEGSAVGWAVAGVLAATHIVFGFTVGRWWALWLPLLAILLAVPAGFPESRWSEPLPVSYGMALYAPFEMALLVLGTGARKLVDWTRSKRERDR
jgi:hypothetical protein